jgi:hypothetical protein
MAEQAGHGNGQGATPRRDPRLPEGIPSAQGRDSHLPGFAAGGEWDACPPDDTRMDQYRATAYLDLLNGVTADVRIASGLLPGTCSDADNGCVPPEEDEHGDDPDDGAPGGEGPQGPHHGGPSTGGGQPGGQQGTQQSPAAAATPPRLADLVLPLATLLGLAERPCLHSGPEAIPGLT